MTSGDADPWTRLDTGLVVALSLATLLTRAALRTTGYYSVDAGLLAVGAQEYDFADHQPHPPYYPLVIAVAHLLAPLLGALPALTWMAIGSSILTVAGTYALGLRITGRGTALLAALIVLASPIALRNGAVPLSYAEEGLAAVAVAYAALVARTDPSRRSALVLGAVASLAVGVRPSSLVLLAPMLLWAIVPRWRLLGWASLAGAATTLAWFVPALALGGGLADFLYGVHYQSSAFILSDPVWKGGWTAVREHALWLAYHARHGLPFVAWVLGAGVVGAFGVHRNWPRAARGLFAAWLVPGVAFYVLVYAGWPVYPDGYLMALVPGVAVLAALILRGLWLAVHEEQVPAFARGLGTLAVAALMLQPVAWVAQWDDAMRPARDAERWEASMAGLESAFPPNETALFTFNEEQWLRLDHPDYLVWNAQVFTGPDGLAHVQYMQDVGGEPDKGFFVNLRDGLDDPFHPIPPWVRRVAVIEGHPSEPRFGHVISGAETHVETLPGGAQVTWFEPGPFQYIEEALTLTHVRPAHISPRGEPPS